MYSRCKIFSIEPRSSQHTDEIESWSLLSLNNKALEYEDLLSEWKGSYNHNHAYLILNDKTPGGGKFEELKSKHLFKVKITQMFWDSPVEEAKLRGHPYLLFKAKLPQIS